MAKYLLVYYGGGGMEPDPKTRQQVMDVWTKWFQSLGKEVVDMGAPTQPGKIVTGSGVKDTGKNPVAGYSVVQADSLDAAVAMARSHPHVKAGLQIAVYPFAPM